MEHENQDSRDIDILNSDDFLHLFNIGTGDKNLPIKIKVNVEGLILNMELDSGSAVTALSNNFYSKYYSHIPISSSKTTLISYSGEKIKPAGTVPLNFTYNDKTCPLDVFIINNGGPPLLGRDFVCKFNLGI